MSSLKLNAEKVLETDDFIPSIKSFFYSMRLSNSVTPDDMNLSLS